METLDRTRDGLIVLGSASSETFIADRAIRAKSYSYTRRKFALKLFYWHHSSAVTEAMSSPPAADINSFIAQLKNIIFFR